MPVVLDCSVAMTWRFLDEASGAADRLLDHVAEHGAIVPALWHLEVANALLIGERRARLKPAQVAEFIALLGSLPIRIDETMTVRAWHEIRALAQEHALTAYDAAYLDLAMRTGSPLASKDRDLCLAAERAGVEVIAV
jgi:predicted nucleic acid-binding protein